MTELRRVKNEEKTLLFNLLQKYLYEMSGVYGDDIDAAGNYAYNYFDAYFTDETRKPLFIIEEGAVAGFVMLNKYSFVGGEPDNMISEFCVLPKYRKAHVARRAFELLCREYPGKWELKYSVNNVPAAKLWNEVTKPYSPKKYELEDGEEAICFSTEKLNSEENNA